MSYINALRLAGDVSHMLSFLALLFKVHRSKSVAGISLKTQELYVLVFLARYVDLFWNHISVYNSVMKVVFITLSVSVVGLMRRGAQRSTYNSELDSFPHHWLVLPCLLLGIAVNQDYSSPFEMSWAFSIYLEAVAIIPQLHMVQKDGQVDNITAHYIFLLGMYRVLYLFNWIYRCARARTADARSRSRRAAGRARALHAYARTITQPPWVCRSRCWGRRHIRGRARKQVRDRGKLLAGDRMGLGIGADGALLRLLLQLRQIETKEPLPADRRDCIARVSTGWRFTLFDILTSAVAQLRSSDNVE